MALHKRTPASPKMPFPGDSPTVSLALAAGQKYGLNEVEEKTPPKASPSKTGKKKAASSTARKPSATRKAKTKSKSK